MDVTPGSEQMVWWLCPLAEDHEWENMPARRVLSPKCPFCVGRRPSSTSSLLAMNSKVATEWHPSLNQLTPDRVTPASQRKAWWLCRVDPRHEWEAVIRNRAVLGNGCPFCSGFYASADHSLQAKHPEVALSWHPTKNGALTPCDVPPAAKRSVWWKCDRGSDHEWRGPVYVAASAGRGAGCPFCACRRLSVTNRLAVVYPELAREWHPTLNAPLTSTDIVHGSPRRVWWKCEADPLHEWRTSVVARTRAGSGCPYCTLAPRSLQEILLAFELREFVPFDVDDHKITIPDGDCRKILDVDMVLRQHRLIVEFDGSFWHRTKRDADCAKTALLVQAGWTVVRLREAPLEILHPNDVQVPHIAIAGPKPAADTLFKHLSRTFPELELGLDPAYFEERHLRSELRARRYALRIRTNRAEPQSSSQEALFELDDRPPVRKVPGG